MPAFAWNDNSALLKLMYWETSSNLQKAVLKAIGERSLPPKLLDAIKDHKVIKALLYDGQVNGHIIEKLAETLLENKFCINNDQKAPHLAANLKYTMQMLAQAEKSREDQARQEAELRRLQNLRSSLPLKSAGRNAKM